MEVDGIVESVESEPREITVKVAQSIEPLLMFAVQMLDELRAALARDGAADQLKGVPANRRKDFLSTLRPVTAEVESSLT